MTRRGLDVLYDARWASWRYVKRERCVAPPWRGEEMAGGDDIFAQSTAQNWVPPRFTTSPEALCECLESSAAEAAAAVRAARLDC